MLRELEDSDSDDPNQKYRSVMKHLLQRWKGGKDFLKAQGQMFVVLGIAYLGNNFPKAYPRNDNHNMTMFWLMNVVLLLAGIITLKHDTNGSARGIQLLSRAQTEEWKGWMQWAFIMYHYYRAYPVYNEIRVFVSAYVWMTGFGNFLYFDKSGAFTIDRAISMWLRINYFPLLLSLGLGVALELYYVVPLHTAGFFITMGTCYIAKKLERFYPRDRPKCNVIAIAICLLAHVLFYETPAVNFLKLFSDEYHFRFQADKYSAWVGMVSGFCWSWFKSYIQWCYGENADHPEDTKKIAARWGQRVGGVALIVLWYVLVGHITDKYTYNPIHPYLFWMPVAGWLMVRNSSKYLTEVHMGAMEFFGRITLETYVLQFHVFMCRDVQYIPIVIPGSGPDGHIVVKTLNMLLCGTAFVALAFWARQLTVTTQETFTDLVHLLVHGPPATPTDDEEEGVSLTKAASNDDNSESLRQPAGEKPKESSPRMQVV